MHESEYAKERGDFVGKLRKWRWGTESIVDIHDPDFRGSWETIFLG